VVADLTASGEAQNFELADIIITAESSLVKGASFLDHFFANADLHQQFRLEYQLQPIFSQGSHGCSQCNKSRQGIAVQASNGELKW
jgi:hypothetical protein